MFRFTQTITGGALSLCFAKVTMLTSVTYRYFKLSVLWLHCGSVRSHNAATIRIT